MLEWTTKDIEELATSAVKNSMITAGYLGQYISENDKEPSIDGYVYIYNNKKKRNDDFRGKVAVQIKGTIKDDIFFDSITYSVRVSDLRHYLYIGGAIYFVVYISNDGTQTQIYYNTLTPVKLMTILENCADQDYKSINFKPFPTDGDRKSTIFLQFFTDCKKQASFQSENMLSFDDDEIQSQLQEIKMTVTGFGTKDAQQMFFENEVYAYGVKKGENILIPFKSVPESMFTIEDVDCNISVNHKDYYASFRRIRSINGTKAIIGNSLTVKTDSQNNLINVSYKESPKLSDRVKDLDFFLSLLDHNGFMMDETEVPFIPETDALKSFDLEGQKQQLNFLINFQRVLNMLNVQKDVDLTKLNEKDIREVNNLITAFIEQKPVSNLNPNLCKLIKIQIQDIVLALVYEKVDGEPGTYMIYDFSRYELRLSYQIKGQSKTHITSQYSILTEDNFCELDNIDYATILPSYQALVSVNEDLPNRANLDMLTVLKAYDKCHKPQLLQVAEEMAIWLSTFSGDDFDYQVRLLNLLQIQKRKRALTTDELQQLCEITESADSREDIKVGAYLLMDNQIAAKIHFAKLTPEIQTELEQYPIFHFWKE